jgi:AraC family transcriptional regulator of adaptative response / DNA-3-methyladenine glycosylase II
MGQPDRDPGLRVAGGLELELRYREPLDVAWLVGFFARRAVAGVEEATPGGGFRRSVRLGHGAGVVELRPLGDGRLTARLTLDDERDAEAAEQACRALFDLDCDPAPIVGRLGADPVIGASLRAAPGLRVPGTSDPDELAVRALLGQQVSLAAARTLAGRLVADHGERLDRPVGAVTHLFPTAAAIARADPARLAMPASRQRALLGLARALAGGAIALEPRTDHDAVRRQLLALPGIGPWTTEYVAMRALRDPDAFIAGDLGVRRGLERLGRDGSPRAATRLAEAWRPFRAYAVQHLWAQLAA